MIIKDGKLLFCPKENEIFYYYSLYRESVQEMYFTKNNERCLQNWALGNCFPTYQDAEAKGEAIMKELREEYKRAEQKPKDKSLFWYYSLFSGSAISTTFSSFNERDLEDWRFKNFYDTEKEANIKGCSEMENLREEYESSLAKDLAQA